MPTTTSTWCDLPLELLELILNKLVVIDIVRFKSVCSCWKRAVKSYTSSPNYTPLHEAPWLVVSPDHQQEQTDDNPDHYFRFFSLSEKRFYKIKTSFKGFDSHGLRCAGSSYGWLGICNFDKARAYLLNPVSGLKIDLLSTVITYCGSQLGFKVHQLVSSSDPSHSRNFFVVVRYTLDHKHIHLAFCKNGDKRWRILKSHQSCTVSVTFHKGHLYALGKETLEVWDFGGTYLMKTMDFRHGLEHSVNVWDALTKFPCVNMVESLGELYLFANEIHRGPIISTVFKIFKLNLTKKEWEKVENLNDQAIFHDLATGVKLLSTRNLPQLEGNSIYFNVGRNCEFGTLYPRYEVMSGLLCSFERKFIEEYLRKGIEYDVWIVPNPW